MLEEVDDEGDDARAANGTHRAPELGRLAEHCKRLLQHGCQGVIDGADVMVV